MFHRRSHTDTHHDRQFPHRDRARDHKSPAQTLNGGLPLVGLPLEITVRIRELLEPIDIIECSLVSKAWRRHIFRPDSLYHLATIHNTHSVDGSCRDPLTVTADDIRRWQRQDPDSLTTEELQASLQHIFGLVQAHQYGMPASVLSPATDARRAKATQFRPKLVRQYLLRLISECQIEVIDLLRNIAFHPPCEGRRIKLYALTTQLYAHTSVETDVSQPGQTIHIGKLTAPHLPGTVVTWDEELRDAAYGRPRYESDILALAGDAGTVVAVRHMTCDRIDGYGFLILRSDDDHKKQEIRFFESGILGVTYAMKVADNQCRLFIASEEFARGDEETLLDIITITIDGPPRHSETCDPQYTDIWRGPELLICQTGYKEETLVQFLHEAVILDCPEGENGHIDLPLGSAIWKGRYYEMDDEFMFSRPLRDKGFSGYTAVQDCIKDSFIVMNDTFLIVSHLKGYSRTCNASYHAYCFDQEMRLGTSERDILSCSISDRNYDLYRPSAWVKRWDDDSRHAAHH